LRKKTNKKKRVMEKIVMEAKEGEKKRGTKGKIEQMKIMLLTRRYIFNKHKIIMYKYYEILYNRRKKYKKIFAFISILLIPIVSLDKVSIANCHDNFPEVHECLSAQPNECLSLATVPGAREEDNEVIGAYDTLLLLTIPTAVETSFQADFHFFQIHHVEKPRRYNWDMGSPTITLNHGIVIAQVAEYISRKGCPDFIETIPIK
ncbi:hypothetical protein ACJX0J_022069, partial [Zea mays]